MIIGVPKEIKANEGRVSMTPAGVHSLVVRGHSVIVETNAGEGTAISDNDYREAGAQIASTAAETWRQADMIVKVKEPLESEFQYFKPGQLLFTYLHLASAPDLTKALLASGEIGIAYETIEVAGGLLPLLKPMSEVAGRMAVQVGVHYLQKPYGGKGVFIGGVPGVPAGKIVIIGSGTVATNALKVAVGMGAQVTVVARNLEKLRQIDDQYGGRVTTYAANPMHIAEAVKSADLLIGAVLEAGAKAPKLVSEAMVKSMQPGAVIVDVAIDQGGCIETIDHATTHADPVYTKHGVVHYAVANMPGAVPQTSTYALTNATLPYVLKLADQGIQSAVKADKSIAKGVNTCYGSLTCEPVGKAFNLPVEALDNAIGG